MGLPGPPGQPHRVGFLLEHLPAQLRLGLGGRAAAGGAVAAGSYRLDAFVEGFSGSHRFVLDYLSEEVLDRQPDHLVRFLLETSVLERLSGGLCEVVTGRADSQALLERVERANLFLVPLDEVRGWWSR